MSVIGDRAWLGGVEGTAVATLDAEGAPHVERTVALRRVQRAVRFGGATWLGTYGDGLFRLDDGAPGPAPVGLGRGPARDRVTDLLVVGDELWVATAGSGVVRVGADSRVRGRVARGLADLLVWDLEPTPDGRVLVATVAGISVAARDGSVDASAPEARASAGMRIRDVRSLARIGDRTFAATWGGGVYRIDAGASRATRIDRGTVASANVVASAGDGVLVGHDGGLAHAALDASRLEPVPTTGLPSADLTAIARAFGAIWIGTFDHGLARIRNGRAESVTRAHDRFAVDLRINDLAVTHARGEGERLWIATDRGLYFHDGAHFIPVEDPEGPGRTHVTSLHVANDGSLYATSSRVLSRLRRGRWRSFHGSDELPVMHLHAVTTDAHGNVWVGSLHGLYRFDPRAGTFSRESTATGALPVDWVTALLPWRDGVVVGTYHGGLSWNAGSHFEIERESHAPGGLPAGWVNPHAMRFVGGTLLVGTLERGLAVGERGHWTHVGTEDGLPSADVTGFLPATEGGAWVTTRGGLARVVFN